MDGIDLNWPQRDFSLEDAFAAVRAGKQFAMIGRNPSNENAWIQRGHLQHAGMQHIGEYLESMGGDDLPVFFPETRLVGFAVEKDSGYAGKAGLIDVASRIQAAGKVAICYASLASWREAGLEDDWDELAQIGVLLWCPGYHYDGQPRGLTLETPFGGWTSAVMEQYFGGSELGGQHIPGQIEGIGYDIDLDQCDASLWGVDEIAQQPSESEAPAPPAPPAPGEDFGMLEPMELGESIALIDEINHSAGNWISDAGVAGAFRVTGSFNGQPIQDDVEVVAIAFRRTPPVTSAEPGA